MPPPPFTIEFYEDPNGFAPVRTWLREELSPTLRRAAGHAMNEILQQQGVEVCDSGWGKQVAPGIFEFRIDRDPSEVVRAARGERDVRPREFLLRIFCHAHGDKLLLLLGGYDKAADVSKQRQQSEIERAKKRLTAWRERRKRLIVPAVRPSPKK